MNSKRSEIDACTLRPPGTVLSDPVEPDQYDDVIRFVNVAYIYSRFNVENSGPVSTRPNKA